MVELYFINWKYNNNIKKIEYFFILLLNKFTIKFIEDRTKNLKYIFNWKCI